jgi:hypothetical protein
MPDFNMTSGPSPMLRAQLVGLGDCHVVGHRLGCDAGGEHLLHLD